MPFKKMLVNTIKPGSPTPVEFKNNFDLTLLENRFPGVSSKSIELLEEEYNATMPVQGGNASGFIEQSISTTDNTVTSYSIWESRNAYIAACQEVNYSTDTNNSQTTDFVYDFDLISIPYEYIKAVYASEHVTSSILTYSEI